MTDLRIRLHDFNGQHWGAVSRMAQALSTLDAELRTTARRADLHAGARYKAQFAAREKADAVIRAARAELHGLVAYDRESATYAEQPEDEQTVSRRALYLQQARADLEGRRADEAIVLARQAVQSGNHERAREVLRIARPIVAASEWAPELRRLQNEAMPASETMHRCFARKVESFASELELLDQHVADLAAGAGRLSDAQIQGWEDEPPALDTRLLSMWFARSRDGAEAAGFRHASELIGIPVPEQYAQGQQRGDVAADSTAATEDAGAATAVA